MNKEMNIKEKFLSLTSRTYPHGTEQELFHLLSNDLQEDEFGNLFIKIGDSDCMFTSHLDTATSALTTITHVFDGNIIKTDGKSILGADDKAGVVIMLYMIEQKVPGLYYFFLGEEVGCIGSKKVAGKQKVEKIDGINKVISFDRRGTKSVITHQSSQRCTSEKFGEALSKALNDADETFEYKNDDTGVLTDSIQFVKIYPECTNISVGYQSEHTYSESQDIEHLDKLAKACCKIDWVSLPFERDPSVTEYKSYGGGYYGRGYGYGEDWDDWEYGGTGTSGSKPYNSFKPTPKKNEKIYFHDVAYNFVSCVEYDGDTKKIVKVELGEERILSEKKLIKSLLISLELDFLTILWDGFKLEVIYDVTNVGDISTCDRNDLIDYIPELDYSNIDELIEY